MRVKRARNQGTRNIYRRHGNNQSGNIQRFLYRPGQWQHDCISPLHLCYDEILYDNCLEVLKHNNVLLLLSCDRRETVYLSRLTIYCIKKLVRRRYVRLGEGTHLCFVNFLIYMVVHGDVPQYFYHEVWVSPSILVTKLRMYSLASLPNKEMIQCLTLPKYSLRELLWICYEWLSLPWHGNNNNKYDPPAQLKRDISRPDRNVLEPIIWSEMSGEVFKYLPKTTSSYLKNFSLQCLPGKRIFI